MTIARGDRLRVSWRMVGGEPLPYEGRAVHAVAITGEVTKTQASEYARMAALECGPFQYGDGPYIFVCTAHPGDARRRCLTCLAKHEGEWRLAADPLESGARFTVAMVPMTRGCDVMLAAESLRIAAYLGRGEMTRLAASAEPQLSRAGFDSGGGSAKGNRDEQRGG